MKLILSTTSAGLDASLDPRFGRCAYFLLIDPQTMEWQSLPNPALHSGGGAGVQAAQLAANHQCQAVVSGEFGPNAFDALAAAGIDMYKYGALGSVQEVIEGYLAGTLERVQGPGNAGHHGR